MMMRNKTSNVEEKSRNMGKESLFMIISVWKFSRRNNFMAFFPEFQGITIHGNIHIIIHHNLAAPDHLKSRIMHYLTCQEGDSANFYEIVAVGANVTMRNGRSGSEGVSSVKAFPSAAEANEFVDKIVGAKIKEGYVAVARAGAGAGSKRAAEESVPKAVLSSKKGKDEPPMAAVVKQPAAADDNESKYKVAPLSKTAAVSSSASKAAERRKEVHESNRNVRIFSYYP